MRWRTCCLAWQECRDTATLVLDPAKVALMLEQLEEFKRELQGGWVACASSSFSSSRSLC